MFTESPSINTKSNPEGLIGLQKEASELTLVHDRLSKLNSEYASTLYEVEEKLHSIKNMRTPEKSIQDGIDKGGGGNNDFISAINQQLEIFNQYNSRLQKVLKHCSSII